MTSKKGQSWRIEVEIDKNREDSNWKKVIELAEQMKTLCPGNDCLSNFLNGEARLESFLEQSPPTESNIIRAKGGLGDAKRFLELAASEKDKQAPVALDAQLLLGKLHYAMGAYSDALFHYQEAELHALTEKQLPSRSLRIVAESFAIKGLCLEKLPPTSKSKYKIAEWHSQMIRCYEVAADITIVFLQEQDKNAMQQQNGTLTATSTSTSSANNHHTSKHIGPILETAILRAPLIHLQANNILSAVECYRNLLTAIETTGTQILRLTLSRQLAEILFRGMKSVEYVTPEIKVSTPSGRNRNQVATDSPWKPKKYSGPNIFVPKNKYEEIILLLLISEAMAVRDAVLSQFPEFREARLRSFQNATAVYNLLAIVLVRWSQIELLNESFERAMKFSHEQPHVWLQWSLCLISLGRYVHGFAVLKEAVRLSSTKVIPCLLAAKVCYEQLNRIEEGIEFSEMALRREQSEPQGFLSRCHLYIGIGNSILRTNTIVKQDRNQFSSAAFDNFVKAQQYDPNDHLAEYYLALEHASNRQVQEAITHVKIALSLRAEHIPSLHLLSLLLTAQKQYTEALHLIESILLEYPDNLNILYVKAHLQLHNNEAEEALVTIKHMFFLWKNLYEEQTSIDFNEQQSERRSESRSVFQMYSSEMSDKDSNSLHTQSIAASKVERAMSEVASSLSSFIPKPGPQKAWMIQLQMWLLLTEVFLDLKQIKEATLSLQEAAGIFPLSHLVLYMRGLLHEHKAEYEEAKQLYSDALSINPSHVKSLQHIGLVYHYLGMHRIAEKTLRDAAKIDPLSYFTWFNLGKVLHALEEFEAAADCFETALEVEAHSPILPVSTIPITFE